ncbi:BspA family leucine-rich repeat surface protein [Mycoplasma putrefaciens]|uniref:BspA family leucine-rich repeat surface protein n=1 Tax=Mycoplasma putrefaciens TaxID=2123 RepID=UPI003DA637F4
MDKNLDKDIIQNSTDQVEDLKNDVEDQQQDQENKISRHNKNKFLKVLGITGLVSCLAIAAAITVVVKFYQPKSPDSDADIIPDETLIPDENNNPDNHLTPDKTPNPQPTPEPDKPNPTPNPNVDPVTPVVPDNINELKLPDRKYIDFIWNKHFKNKRSSLETFKDVEDNFKYVLKQARPQIKEFKIEFNNISNRDTKLDFKRDDYKLKASYENEQFDLEIGKVNNSSRPMIIKVVDYPTKPWNNQKLMSFLSSQDITNEFRDDQIITYEVVQLGYSKVTNNSKERPSLKTLVEIITMPGEVQKVNPNLPREIESLRRVFSKTETFKDIDGIKNWDTSNIKSMRYAFRDSSFNGDLSNWDTSNVIDMGGMFQNSAFNNNSITKWNTSKVVDMNAMFAFLKAFDHDINTKQVTVGNKTYLAWDTSSVEIMSRMFQETNFNQDISNWDTSKVFGMERMFHNDKLFNQNINTKQVTVGNKTYLAWNTLNVKNIKGMFENAIAFNSNIDNWNVSKLENAFELFRNAKIFNQSINTRFVILGNTNYVAWDTINLKTVEGMFWGAKAFNGDISKWNTSKIESLENVFRDAEAFNQNISTKEVSDIAQKSNYTAWDVKKVNNINHGFYNAKSFDQDLFTWDVREINKHGRTKSWDEGTTSWKPNKKPWITVKK